MFLNELRAFFVVRRPIFMVPIDYMVNKGGCNVSNFKRR